VSREGVRPVLFSRGEGGATLLQLRKGKKKGGGREKKARLRKTVPPNLSQWERGEEKKVNLKGGKEWPP